MKWIDDEAARFIVGILLWLTVTAAVAALFFVEIPSNNRDLVIALTSGLLGALVATVNFYNKTGVANDRQKDDTINKLTTTAASIQAQTQPPDIVPVAPGETKTVVGTGDDTPS